MNHTIPQNIKDLINDGALFFCSTSGGKDSQAMYLYLNAVVPQQQIVLVHADLGTIEWDGVQQHIKDTTWHPLHVVKAKKTLFDMVRHRRKTKPDVPSWPSSAHRQCTSDLKRGPLHKFIRHYMKDHDASLGVNCTGIRAGESKPRAKKNPFTTNQKLTIPSRTVFEWMPIFTWSTDDVFQYIAAHDQKPFWAYETNERLSCVFCIMGSKNDLQHGAKQRPELLDEYAKLEEEVGYTMFRKKGQNIPIKQYIGEAA